MAATVVLRPDFALSPSVNFQRGHWLADRKCCRVSSVPYQAVNNTTIQTAQQTHREQLDHQTRQWNIDVTVYLIMSRTQSHWQWNRDTA